MTTKNYALWSIRYNGPENIKDRNKPRELFVQGYSEGEAIEKFFQITNYSNPDPEKVLATLISDDFVQTRIAGFIPLYKGDHFI